MTHEFMGIPCIFSFVGLQKKEIISEFQFIQAFSLHNETENDDFFHPAKQLIHPSIC